MIVALFCGYSSAVMVVDCHEDILIFSSIEIISLLCVDRLWQIPLNWSWSHHRYTDLKTSSLVISIRLIVASGTGVEREERTSFLGTTTFSWI